MIRFFFFSISHTSKTYRIGKYSKETFMCSFWEQSKDWRVHLSEAISPTFLQNFSINVLFTTLFFGFKDHKVNSKICLETHSTRCHKMSHIQQDEDICWKTFKDWIVALLYVAEHYFRCWPWVPALHGEKTKNHGKTVIIIITIVIIVIRAAQ